MIFSNAKTPYFALSGIFIGLTACSGGAGTSDGEVSPETTSEDIQVADCSLNAHEPSSNGVATASIHCAHGFGGANGGVQGKVCMDQLVTGGWRTIDWTCSYYDATSLKDTGGSMWSLKVPYYTSGRWYRTWAWIDANGVQQTTTGPTCKGPNGC
jgi:hypothetical protein